MNRWRRLWWIGWMGVIWGTSLQGGQAPLPEGITLAVAGGRLIDGYGGAPLENSLILIRGNRIAAVGQVGDVQLPEDLPVVDTNGMTVLPGLWESHGHLFHIGEGTSTDFQPRFADRAREIMEITARLNLEAGITSFRDTGTPAHATPVQIRLREEIRKGQAAGPRLFVAGPVIRQRDRTEPVEEGHFSVAAPEEARQVIGRLVELGVDQVKVYGFWDLPLLEAVVREAHAAGLGVDADVRHMEAYRTAVRAGVDRLHHVFTADPLSDYSPEELRLLVRGERPIALGPSANILRGPYIIPTMQMRQAYVDALRFPEIVEHPRLRRQFPLDLYQYLRASLERIQAIPWGVGAIPRMEAVRAKVRRFLEAGGREQIVAGCDAGSPLNFHSPLAKELANLVRAGLTEMEAIQAATLRPAQMQGVEAELGSIIPGKLADLIVVDGDPLQDITLLQHRIVHVIQDGRLIR